MGEAAGNERTGDLASEREFVTSQRNVGSERTGGPAANASKTNKTRETMVDGGTGGLHARSSTAWHTITFLRRDEERRGEASPGINA